VTAQQLSVLGLILNAFGVVMLFFFGMPFRIGLREGEVIVTESVRPEVAKRDAMYRRFGVAGLVLIIVGTFLQIVGVMRG
jgi:hypothetical protein